MSIKLASIDYIAIAAYFGFVFFVAWKMTDRSKINEKSDEYFLGGRNLGWFAIGASVFASNIGSEHLVGLAGTAASSGVAVAQFEILASFILLLLGWFFVPFYLRSGVTTMPEFLEQRFSKGARVYLSIISVLAYVLAKISVTIYAGAVIFEAMGFQFWTGAIVVVLATGIYTVYGGLKAVIYTDLIQMFIMLGGSLAVTLIGLNKLGGVSELINTVPPEFMSMWKPSNHPDFPWTGILFGAPILGVWYWCTDQFVVQRVLSAKNITHARRGSLFGGFLKVTPLFLFVIPGVICYALAQKGMLQLDKSDNALPTLIASVLPTGVKGVVIAGLLAALMSSLSSVFNSCSTLVTYDFYKKIRPDASEKRLVLVGQISTVLLVIVSFLWIPMMKVISKEVYKYIQSVQAYISPPIAAVFLLGIFSRRLNAKGAMSALWTGFFLGITRLALELNKEGLTGIVKSFVEINFLHFAFFLFVICSAVMIVVSLMSEKPELAKIENITVDWAKKTKLDSDAKWDVKLSILLAVIVGIIWWVFS